jgi:hypothetical protein
VKRWQLAVVAVGLVLFGLVLGLGYSVVRHAGSDHLNHHVMIVVINELIRRDPSLAAVVDAALGVPDTVTAPPVEEAEPPADEPDSP